jgi:hypothetical protein
VRRTFTAPNVHGQAVAVKEMIVTKLESLTDEETRDPVGRGKPMDLSRATAKGCVNIDGA